MLGPLSLAALFSANSGDEQAALLEQCAHDSGAAGAHDPAMNALLARIGLRRSDAVTLDLMDYDLEIGAITI
jgi:integrase/recombinase XerD